MTSPRRSILKSLAFLPVAGAAALAGENVEAVAVDESPKGRVFFFRMTRSMPASLEKRLLKNLEDILREYFPNGSKAIVLPDVLEFVGTIEV